MKSRDEIRAWLVRKLFPGGVANQSHDVLKEKAEESGDKNLIAITHLFIGAGKDSKELCRQCIEAAAAAVGGMKMPAPRTGIVGLQNFCLLKAEEIISCMEGAPTGVIILWRSGNTVYKVRAQWALVSTTEYDDEDAAHVLITKSDICIANQDGVDKFVPDETKFYTFS